MVTDVFGFVVTEVLENGEEVCIYKEMEFFTGHFLATLVVVWGKSMYTLGYLFLVSVMIPGAIYNNY